MYQSGGDDQLIRRVGRGTAMSGVSGNSSTPSRSRAFDNQSIPSRIGNRTFSASLSRFSNWCGCWIWRSLSDDRLAVTTICSSASE